MRGGAGRAVRKIMDPFKLLKLKSLFERFKTNHPKVPLFLRAAIGEIQEGTVVEVKVTPPEGKSIVTNIRINQEDLELIEAIKSK